MNLRTDFHTDLAQMFINDIQLRHSKYFYFLGKTDPWGEFQTPPMGDISTHDNSLQTRNHILYSKRIESSMVSMVTDIFVWEPNIVFKKWDHSKEMKGTKFYCLTGEPDFRVYKCIDNAGDSISTVKPFGTSVYPLRTDDGYLWKYMYTIPSSKRKMFVSGTHMPVQRAMSDSFYDRGSVERIVVVDQGFGYLDVQNTFINVSGTTTGSGASVVIDGMGEDGSIQSLIIINPGSEYFKGADVKITSDSGKNFEVDLEFNDNGELIDYTIINGGYGYDVLDTVQIVTGGAVIIPAVSRITGSIDHVIIKNPGAGYTTTPILTVVGTLEDPGTGLYEGNLSAIVDAIEDNGKIVRVTISDPGAGYPSDTNTTIVVSGDGTEALFSPIIHEGSLISVVIENPGLNYSSMTLTVVGAGVDALLQPILSTSDLLSDQNIIEQTAVPGAIYAIEVNNEGSLYSSETTLTIVGDGEGCQAVPVIFEGKIKYVVVTDYGKNYTYADVIINDETGSGAWLYIILPPINGHGYDATKELFSDSITISVLLRLSTTNYSFDDISFRQFGILKNPRDIFYNKIFNKNEDVLSYTALFNHTNNLKINDILLINKYRYKVIKIDNLYVDLILLSATNVQPLGLLINENDFSREYKSELITHGPSLNKFSGSLIYAFNDIPFSFTDEQGIILKTIISF